MDDACLSAAGTAVEPDDVHELEVMAEDGKAVQKGRRGPGQRDLALLLRERRVREHEMARAVVEPLVVPRACVGAMPETNQRA